MPKLNYYSKMKAENKTLRLICNKYTNLDEEPLFLKYLSGKIIKPEQVIELPKINDNYIVEFN
tara:strand:+ start:1077 stop:1265 length:189 start_codon:yes stop_codon:yes gene_type:complete